MKIGFTGTQIGMSDKQKEQFVLDLLDLNPTECHHGDCIGADAEAHDIVRAFFPDCLIILHPPKVTSKRAYKKADASYPPEEYLDRNHKIVEKSEVLFGTPKNDTEELRSGTRATIRYGRKLEKLGKIAVIVLPR